MLGELRNKARLGRVHVDLEPARGARLPGKRMVPWLWLAFAAVAVSSLPLAFSPVEVAGAHQPRDKTKRLRDATSGAASGPTRGSGGTGVAALPCSPWRPSGQRCVRWAVVGRDVQENRGRRESPRGLFVRGAVSSSPPRVHEGKKSARLHEKNTMSRSERASARRDHRLSHTTAPALPSSYASYGVNLYLCSRTQAALLSCASAPQRE